ncbi:hypothetical protein AGOR_G00165890 [Albula goreensis]|uniref:Uncharacterized protein n=1 Tax=Albula goreensis TaxID=1534307 RepID=A0A8T3D236_9TELE|nr:hypothetical protein AGOR_G00165890 [Albula goreensis]
MDRILLVLQEVDHGLLQGIHLGKESRELASIICSVICEHKSQEFWDFPNGKSSCVGEENNGALTLPTHKSEVQQKELACFALSILERMSSFLLSSNHPVDGSLYYKEVLRTSLEDMELMLKLVSLFSNQDNALSHLAVKCASTVVLFQLLETNSFNRVWQQMSFQTFQRGMPSNEMAACVWSLTAIVKGLMKGTYKCKNETLEKLLVEFDPVFPDLYTRLLSWREPGTDVAACQVGLFNLETVQITLIDLLEVLTVARVKLHICSMSQRILYLHASVLLQLVNSPAHYVVKKKALLLLKRVLLQKAGEDLALEEVQPPAQADDHMTTDMWTLVDSVLHVIHSGWLHGIPVSAKASFFGGTDLSGPGSREGPDFVILRGVSLILLKSLQYKVQHISEEGSLCSVDIRSYLSPLIVFLRQHVIQKHQLCHSCAWVSLVFGEQDDDMIEAAKTLMLLYLYQRRMNATSDEDACTTGYNPHCHFIFLLKSVAFDHSVLLDFLISAETCFLEYLVGYLKFLRENWEGFCRVCPDTQELDPVEQRRGSSASGQESTARSELSANQTDPQRDHLPESSIAQSSFCPLVDYASSDNSESEEPGNSDGPLDRPQMEKPEFNCVTAGGQSLCLLDHVVGNVSDDHLTHDNMCRKTVMCLMELREVVAKLQKRSLFPYNPASLLRLLVQVEISSGFSERSHH